MAVTALLAGVAGCGSSGASSEQSAIPSNVQLTLGVNAQQRLRVMLHDRSVDVNDVRCGAASGDITPCTLQVANGRRQRGAFTLGVRVNRKSRTVQMGWISTTNSNWRAAIEREARASRRAARGGARTP
jgi:hypothetical protein